MKGAVVWLTGLSGAGKSTLASALVGQLAGRRSVELLDGDEVRSQLSKGLGYTREDRDTNVHRIGYVARLLARHGVLVVVAAIAPYARTRAELAARSAAEGHDFLEVYVNVELETAMARDVKGLYAKARSGQISNFTGVSDPYEPPHAPALEVRTDRDDLEKCVHALRELLVARGLS